MYSIYQVSGPEGRLYIGYTKFSPEIRWKHHLKNTKNTKLTGYFYNAIRKHGPDKFRVFLLDVAKTKSEAKKIEQLYIRLLRANDPEFGYNSTSGSEGVEYTAEVLQKMSLKSKENWKKPSYREKFKHKKRGSHTGILTSLETKQKISSSVLSWYSKNKNARYRMDISDQQLAEEYEKYRSYAAVGRKFGVSGNMVRNRLITLSD